MCILSKDNPPMFPDVYLLKNFINCLDPRPLTIAPQNLTLHSHPRRKGFCQLRTVASSMPSECSNVRTSLHLIEARSWCFENHDALINATDGLLSPYVLWWDREINILRFLFLHQRRGKTTASFSIPIYREVWDFVSISFF